MNGTLLQKPSARRVIGMVVGIVIIGLGIAMWCIINGTKCMSHGVCNTKTYVREAHSCNVLTKSHSFTAFFCIFNSTTK